MQSFLRDLLLSYCPAAVRRSLRPSSSLTVLHTAIWSGLAQFLLAGLLFLVRLKAYFVFRAQQLAPYIAGKSDAVQAGAAVVLTLEYLIHPLGLFLLYLAIEGLIRFMGGLITSEIVPNLLIYCGFRAADSLSRRRERRRATPPLPDTLNHLPDGCVRIASSAAKSGWNASITIGLSGQWMEVEREEQGPAPRPFVYILRPASKGKILRGYQEYDVQSALANDAVEVLNRNE
jgi:hypothetical protein